MRRFLYAMACLFGTSAFAATGLLFSTGELNRVSITETQFTGQCPGIDISRHTAWFVDDDVLPAPGLRVRVTNTTPGFDPDEPLPYTDREYDQGDRSERTIMTIDDEHRTRTFSVQPGVNSFHYRIYRHNQELKSGNFRVNVALEYDRQTRYAQCEWRCDYRDPIRGSCSWRYLCRCPGGIWSLSPF